MSLYANPDYWPNDVDFSVWTIGANGLVGNKLFSQNFAAADMGTTSLATQQHKSIIASTSNVTGLTLDAGSYYVSFYNPLNLAVNAYTNGSGKLYQAGIGFHGDSAGFTLSNDGSNVPEPASLALIGLGILGMSAFTRRRRA